MSTMTDTNPTDVPQSILKSPKHWRNRIAGHHWRTGDEEFDAAKLGMWLGAWARHPQRTHGGRTQLLV